jgi:hypothetical protein
MGIVMAFGKRIMHTLCFMALALSGGWSLAAFGANIPSSTPGKDASRAPRYISIDMKSPLHPLIAGEKGNFELEAVLKQPENAGNRALTWDPKAASPLIVWISSPSNSGITFIDQTRTRRPVHHLLVKFPSVKTATSQPLRVKIPYAINPEAKKGNHVFWLDVAGEMTGERGEKTSDMGIVGLPFEVDTHLKTKLLMLLVVAAAVFLFIVEWVRVDVVGILMMVALPSWACSMPMMPFGDSAATRSSPLSAS